MNTAPWWGTALVAGVFGLAGILAAQFVSIRIERARNIREYDRRWLADRRAAYASFLTSTYSLYRFTADHWDQEFPPEFRDLLRETVFCLQTVRLIASEPVERAATALHSTLFKGAKNRAEGGDGDPQAFKHGITRLREEFQSLARIELGSNATDS